MKIIILYRPVSEHGRVVDEFIREFQRRHEDVKLDTLDVDTRDGSATASLYDIFDYPAILAVREDGSPANVWQGQTMPLISDVAAYAFQ